MSRTHDLLGRVFGRWTVLRRVDNAGDGSAQWLCRCACGTERVVKGKRLVGGDTISCGCFHNEANSASRIEDIKIGRVFGAWEVVRFDGVKKGKAQWLCRCRCGTTRSVIGSNLRRGLSKSCGKIGCRDV